MYHVAIVEDELEFAEQIKEYLAKYEAEYSVKFKVTYFADGADILEEYKPYYDVILFDIEMKKMNGMDAAEKVRELDDTVVMMFITNMANYAIRGYSVGALDFVMKPINYYTFAMKITRALKRVKQKGLEQLLLSLPDGVKRFELNQIYYIEVQNRMLHYHTTEGEYVLRGTMSAVEKQLEHCPFAKCNHWYLVNLMHVKEVRGNITVVGDMELEISRRNKTTFMKALTEYMGGNVR